MDRAKIDALCAQLKKDYRLSGGLKLPYTDRRPELGQAIRDAARRAVSHGLNAEPLVALLVPSQVVIHERLCAAVIVLELLLASLPLEGEARGDDLDVHRSFLSKELQKAAGIAATAFRQYRGKAGVEPRSGKGHGFTAAEARTIMICIAANTPEAKVKDKCIAWLKSEGLELAAQ